MNTEGYRLISETFVADQEAGRTDIEVTVTPVPKEHEDFRFVTITSDPGLPPEVILNALSRAYLLTGLETYRAGAMGDGDLPAEAPELSILGVQPGSLTFEDHNRVETSQLYY